MDFFRVAAEWQRPLKQQILSDYDAFWEQPQNWVEAPNFRRGGWSGVVRMTLSDADGRARIAYLKRQEGQRRRTLSSSGRARPTYYQEFLSLTHFRTLGAPVVDWVCYGERGPAALLVTLAPNGYLSLSELAARGDGALLDQALEATVMALGALHCHRWRHGSCYPAHVLVNPDTLEVRLLDLERSRRRRSVAAAARADLQQLVRRCSFLTPDQVELMVRVARRHAPGLDGHHFPALSA